MGQMHKGWLARDELVDINGENQLLAKLGDIHAIREQADINDTWPDLPTPVPLYKNKSDVQALKGDVHTMISDSRGNAVLARIKDGTFILSEPDLVNNLGIADTWRAYEAHRLLSYLSLKGHRLVAFDITVNGFERGRNLLDLMMHPPFLAMTIALMVAGLLALLGGLVRFGPPSRERRAIPRGKSTLVTNTADMLKLSKTSYTIGGAYVALIRDWAATRLGLPRAMSSDAIVERLDALHGHSRKFSDLAHSATHAQNNEEMNAAAQSLDAWRKEFMAKGK
jgi:hypothetical protein